MSFSDAIGQIDQIVQWEQQLANPAALTQTSSSGGTTTTGETSNTGAGNAAGSSSFADALAQAQSQNGTDAASVLGSTAAGSTETSSASDLLSSGESQLLSALSSTRSSATSSTGTSSSSSVLSALESQLGSASTASAGGASAVTGVSGATYISAAGPSDPRVTAMVQEANSLVGKPYVWGGGHNNFGPQTGYDCSGFVSAVLHAAGYLSSPADTQTLPSQPGIAQGPGQYVTIYDRTDAASNDHVIIEIDGQFYESGGEQGSWGGGGGVEKISTPSASYLATFNQVLHPAGL